jgi:hypothetical protein
MTAIARAEKKPPGNKIVGEDCVWGQEHVIQPKIFPHQTCERQKITKMIQRTPNVVVAIAAAV